ncbi:hypothetical protein CORC01_08859 [Colletotrichum orchidophilum]|uniref:Uncharacterized protein n=1 Tax=Colletotrichum orchidophilum TaxID=1209926 RepID=A0A1G4B3J7_9PEZI|nr:uncharacterized protein CORC01_08859 [Colletotrichum orchidophilum]OHE95862.1 hypothetical protein CORC01_08859 [Colletotrichum orchidophilum]
MGNFFRKDRLKDRDEAEDRLQNAPLAPRARAESSTTPPAMRTLITSTSTHTTASSEAFASNTNSDDPIGISQLYDPANGKAVVDIVFIHGLKGHREKTWTAENASEPWPKTLLPYEIPNARVLAYGYGASVNRIRDHAAMFLHRLTGFRARTETALVRSHTREHLKEVIESTRAILFLGTPHRGLNIPLWAQRLGKSVGVFKQTNTDILGVLNPESEILAEIQDNFHYIIESQITSGRS